MNKPVHVTIGEPFDSFIDSQVESGRFSSAEAGLRLLEEEQAKIDRLREALIESENCGPARDLDREAFLARMRERHP